MGNSNLLKASKNKNDEFYTKYEDIEKEVENYKKHLKDKVIYCNCDDKDSSFYKYFKDNFNRLGLSKLYISGLSNELITHDGKSEATQSINGDFRSDESIEILKQSDIVITNPPFSLFREYVAQLMKYEKDFLVMGNNNAITYKEIFPLLKDNKMWLGYHSNKTMEFALHPDYEKWDRVDEDGVKYGKVPTISWFTNMNVEKKHENIKLTKLYTGNEENYPKYDNYNAIEVSRVNNIPKDYSGVMGVPITFLTKYNPNQFEIIKFRKGDDEKDLQYNGKTPYFRILIKNKNPETSNDTNRI